MYNPEDTILKYKHLFRYGTLFTVYQRITIFRVLGYSKFGLLIHDANEPESSAFPISLDHRMKNIDFMD